MGLALAGLGILFYSPFAARFFMGDDWLWLAAASDVLDHPQHIFERPIYGYFRPVATGLMALWSLLAGANPWAYSLVSLALHGLNTMLLYMVIGHLGATRRVATIAAFLFAIYYLNAPVVAWISAEPKFVHVAPFVRHVQCTSQARSSRDPRTHARKHARTHRRLWLWPI